MTNSLKKQGFFLSIYGVGSLPCACLSRRHDFIKGSGRYNSAVRGLFFWGINGY